MGEMRERMLRGELYIADDPENEAEFGRVQELLGRFNGSAPGAWQERDALLRRTLRHVGEDVTGVTIGRDTLVGAGAVVTRDLPAGVIAAGMPARVVREIGEQDRVDVPPRPT